jgi:hypothetical protein
MGTRADFYIGRGKDAEWLGSIGNDGYPEGLPDSLFLCRTEEAFRTAVKSFLDGRMVRDPSAPTPEEAIKEFGSPLGLPGFQFDPYAPSMDATYPEQGWPWPWEDSNTTDFSYAFDGEEVWITCFGHGWATKAQHDEFSKAYAAWDDSNDEDAEEPKPPWELANNEKVEFPNMKDRQNVTLGRRSGLIVLGR